MSIRQPGVEGKHRYLDGKRQKKRQEEKNGKRRAIGRIVENERRCFVQSLNTECVLPGLMEVVEVEKQHGKQHQHRTKQGVEKKLDGGVELPRASPDADQQIHGNQHGFPENKEEEEIEGHEHAQHAGL